MDEHDCQRKIIALERSLRDARREHTEEQLAIVIDTLTETYPVWPGSFNTGHYYGMLRAYRALGLLLPIFEEDYQAITTALYSGRGDV